jgi:large subunit ribosomal protein L25
MKIVTLSAEQRDALGSANARRLRRAGRLPVNLYGMGRPTANFSLDAHAFALDFERGSRMFELTVGDQTQVCLLKDIQYDALGDHIQHADFWRVDDDTAVTVNVALEFMGAPAEVAGAVIDYVTREVRISCVPRRIPHHLEIEVAGLQVGEHIEAKDIALPEGTVLVDPPDTTIATFHYKHTPVTEEDEETTEDDDSAEPEVITERKPDEGSDE